MANDLVVVTGASGYVAGHCIVKLLDAGYRVRGTLRSLSRSKEVSTWITKARNGVEARNALTFVEAELTDAASWPPALAGARYVIHAASPIPSRAPKRPDDLIVPARDGTLNVLGAAVAAKVERVVQTSSTSTVIYGRDDPNDTVFTEEDWTDEKHSDNTAYTRSKTIAEKAVWAELARLGAPIEWVAVLPGLVLGPVLDQDSSASVQVVAKMLKGDFPGVPPFGWSIVDVRDLADLHLRAMLAPEAAGKRYIGADAFVTMADIARILREQEPALASKVPTRPLPSWLVRAVGLFDAEVRGQLFEIGKVRRASSQKAMTELGWTQRSPDQTIRDTAKSLLRVGALS